MIKLLIVGNFAPTRRIVSLIDRGKSEKSFRALKSSGFNIEDTHLTDLSRIEKLLSMIFLNPMAQSNIDIFKFLSYTYSLLFNSKNIFNVSHFV